MKFTHRLKNRAERKSPKNSTAPHTGPLSIGWGEREIHAIAGRSRRHAGFTLVEMLLVLVILATLAAIVYPKVVGRGEQARVTAAQTQIANFKTALDSFEVDNGYYPKGRNGLNDLIKQPQDAVSWHGPYLESIPKDPWGNDYSYECPGKYNPTSFDVSSAGPPGKDTPIGNWNMQKR
jgi:general secretion pathway protein G